MFAELLRAELEPVTEKMLHRRAAQWYADQQFIHDAIRHAQAAQSFALMAEFLEQSYKRLLWRGELVSLMRLLEALPTAYQTPRLNQTGCPLTLVTPGVMFCSTLVDALLETGYYLLLTDGQSERGNSMVRIVKEPEVRRSELIACAQQLFYTKGYESTSVSDIVNEVGVAKGTFYHYFHSKLAILEAMVEELTAQVMVVLQEIIADETMPAIPKWTQAFAVISNWKIERKAEMLAILRAVQQPENVVLQYKMHQRTIQIVSPELAKIIAQGITEGVFTTQFAQESAEFALAVMQALSDALTEILLCPQNYDNPAVFAERKVRAAQTAVERILGAPPGSLPIIDSQTLAVWFTD